MWRVINSIGNSNDAAIMLKISWTTAADNARSNWADRLMCPSDTMVFVTDVPIFAPMTMGIAFSIGSVPAPTRATVIEVVEDEDCRCYFCHRQLRYSEAQWAHRIPKGYVELYGKAIIHHPLNAYITCDKCNCKALMKPATNPVPASVLIEEIKEDLNE